VKSQYRRDAAPRSLAHQRLARCRFHSSSHQSDNPLQALGELSELRRVEASERIHEQSLVRAGSSQQDSLPVRSGSQVNDSLICFVALTADQPAFDQRIDEIARGGLMQSHLGG